MLMVLGFRVKGSGFRVKGLGFKGFGGPRAVRRILRVSASAVSSVGPPA